MQKESRKPRNASAVCVLNLRPFMNKINITDVSSWWLKSSFATDFQPHPPPPFLLAVFPPSVNTHSVKILSCSGLHHKIAPIKQQLAKLWADYWLLYGMANMAGRLKRMCRGSYSILFLQWHQECWQKLHGTARFSSSLIIENLCKLEFV